MTAACDVLFVAANARSLCANRGDLIKEMTAKGMTVAAAVPEIDYLDQVETLGIEVDRFPMRRAGLNPLFDLRTIGALARIIRARSPRMVFAYGLKPILYGIGVSALVGRADHYAMVTGLGHLFTTHSRKNRLLRKLVTFLYSCCFGACKRVFFQNHDDAALMRSLRGLSDPSKVVVVNGSGINLARFALEDPVADGHVFTFVGRLLLEKGIVEFFEAARRIKIAHPEVRFVAVGPLDPTLPHSVAQDDFDAWVQMGVVEFVGAVADVRPWIKASTVLVLPSYREGTPKAVLEAMSMGRAILTTDAPGCRDTTEHGVNGYLVPVGDVPRLVQAMEKMISNPDEVRIMGRKSRQIAEAKYDVHVVNAKILRHMGVVE